MNAALRRVGIGLGLAVVAFALLLTRGDGAPPDDADLLATAAAPADHANAFLTLTSAAALLEWPRDPAEDARWSALARGEGWDDALAARVPAANDRALAAFARAARQTAFRSPDQETRPDLLAWVELARLQGVRSIALARAGDVEGGLGQALASLRVAKTVGADTNGSELVGAVALAIGDAGLGALRGLAASATLAPERARRLADELASLRSDPAAWRALIAAEYRALAPALAAPGPALRVPAGRAGLGLLASWLPASHLYQPNNTRAALAKAVRERMAAVGPGCPDPSAAPFEITWGSLLLPNAAGRQLVDDVQARASAHRMPCMLDTRVDALRAALGVQLFERERGVLPPSLEALVPDYLGETPRDWLGDAPLHLDRSARELVSVGRGDAERGARAREERFPLLPLPAP